MPHYEIHHSCDLSQSQYQELATAFTNLHCALFSVPSAFVNVSFHSTRPSTTLFQFPAGHTIYVGGQPAHTNYVHGHLRPRGPENAPKLRELVLSITDIWNKHVHTSGQAGEGRLDDPLALHNVFIFEDIVAGAEQGFLLPLAGQDGDWTKDNLQAFEERAQEGDEGMKRLLAEYKVGFGTQT